MDPSPTPASKRRDPDSGRVAVPEIAELLHLQRPAAALAASAVVLLALLLTLVAPDLLPANAVTGVVVGLLAVLAGVAVAVVLDGRDPVLRGPRHLRRDGHTVLARMAGPDAVRHGAPVLAALGRRLDGKGHHSVLLTGTGTDPSALAVALGRGAAAEGHTSLVIDLRSQDAPGVADVGAGTVRLGEAARLAEDRPYAWVGAGVDREAAAAAAAGVARRPPRDLELLIVVAPEAATHVPEVLQACERTVLLVDADAEQRAMVTARMEALRRAGGRPEAVVVGGLRVGDGQQDEIDGAAGSTPSTPSTPSTTTSSSVRTVAAPRVDTEIRPLRADTGPSEPASAPSASEASEAPEVQEAPPAEAAPEESEESEPFARTASDPESEPVAPTASDPATEPVVPPSPEPAPGPEPPPTIPEPDEPDEPEPAPTPEPGPDAPPVVVPDPEHRDDQGPGDQAHDDRPGDDTHEARDADETHEAHDADETHEAHEAHDTGPGGDVRGNDAHVGQGSDAGHDVRPGGVPRDDAGHAGPGPHDADPAPSPRLEDTGPIRPITFRTTGGDDTSVDGLDDGDPLVTTAALEQLLTRQHRDGS